MTPTLLVPLVMAISEMLKAIFEYATKYRESMSQENRDAYDKVLINGWKRWDKFVNMIIPVDDPTKVTEVPK